MVAAIEAVARVGAWSTIMHSTKRRSPHELRKPIRLTASGEEALSRLGPVRRILRLGAMHGIGDPYQKAHFAAELWAEAGGTIYPDKPMTRHRCRLPDTHPPLLEIVHSKCMFFTNGTALSQTGDTKLPLGSRATALPFVDL